MKFSWGKRKIDYVGFTILEDGIRPTDGTLDVIKQFLRPRDKTGIQSFFGLVEQVAFAFSKSALLEPFRQLLKKDSTYVWNDTLQEKGNC